MKDIITAVVLMIFGGGMALYSLEYRNSSTFETDVGSNFVPMVCSLSIALLALVILVSALRNKDEAYNRNVKVETASKVDFMRCAASIVLLLLYVACFRPVGFLISSIVYLFVQITIFTTRENRRWLPIIIVSVGLPVCCYLLFVHVLNYMLPAGILG